MMMPVKIAQVLKMMMTMKFMKAPPLRSKSPLPIPTHHHHQHTHTTTTTTNNNNNNNDSRRGRPRLHPQTGCTPATGDLPL